MKDIRQVAKRRPGDGGACQWNDRGRPSSVSGLTKAWGLLAIVGLLIALAAACGGGDEPQAEGSTDTPANGRGRRARSLSDAPGPSRPTAHRSS